MTQTVVGIRELKAQLSAYMQQLKAGATVVITERGKPIGRIVPLRPSVEARVQELVQAGLMAWSGRRRILLPGSTDCGAMTLSIWRQHHCGRME